MDRNDHQSFFFSFLCCQCFTWKLSFINKLFLQELFAVSNNPGLDPFSDPFDHFRAAWCPFLIGQLQLMLNCRRYSVAGSEQGPFLLLGGYFVSCCLIDRFSLYLLRYAIFCAKLLGTNFRCRYFMKPFKPSLSK